MYSLLKTLRVALREAGRLSGKQGLVNTVIHLSPHTESRSSVRASRMSTEQEPAPALALNVLAP